MGINHESGHQFIGSWESLPKLNLTRRTLEDLSAGRFIDRSRNLILKAENEQLASRAAQTLCNKLKAQGYSISYLRARHLMDVIEKSGRRKVTEALLHYDLVCMDNLNLTALSYSEIHQILKVLEERIVAGPIMFPTPYTLPELGHLFDLFKARSTFESIVFHSIIVDCAQQTVIPAETTERGRVTVPKSVGSHRLQG